MSDDRDIVGAMENMRKRVQRVSEQTHDFFSQLSDEGILARATIVHETDGDVYQVWVDGDMVHTVEAKEVRRQSFPLREFLVRRLRNILCTSCGHVMIAGEHGICSRCEAKTIRGLLALRSRYSDREPSSD